MSAAGFDICCAAAGNLASRNLPEGRELWRQGGQGCILRFGPTDLCSIGIIDPTNGGMNFCDIGPFVFKNPTGAPPIMQLPGGLFE